ncbi:unnamed protein product [Macrosiphum euphorbiae]|uniref:Uncharacterized protein n=1 Tax=Macrosiphum euphorbiae TaxID=13131 RepID=A0AAV0XPH0_9HEMI|nr:unnamed protein product [Macrosiphum euphorbiae]
MWLSSTSRMSDRRGHGRENDYENQLVVAFNLGNDRLPGHTVREPRIVGFNLGNDRLTVTISWGKGGWNDAR